EDVVGGLWCVVADGLEDRATTVRALEDPRVPCDVLPEDVPDGPDGDAVAELLVRLRVGLRAEVEVAREALEPGGLCGGQATALRADDRRLRDRDERGQV